MPVSRLLSLQCSPLPLCCIIRYVHCQCITIRENWSFLFQSDEYSMRRVLNIYTRVSNLTKSISPATGLLNSSNLKHTSDIIECHAAICRSSRQAATRISGSRSSSHTPTMNVSQRQAFKDLFTPELEALREICKRNGMDIRMAGGAVRDILQNIVPHDIDFASTTEPAEMNRIFTKEGIRLIEYGSRALEHGTVTVRINDKVNYEITTTRSDVTCNGRHAQVVFHQDWEADANRRDLTINSMFLDLEGNLYDFFNGHDDLMNKRVRFVGDGDARIKEDYLRIMRYFRFYGKIKADPVDHEQKTLETIRRNTEGLLGVAGERIWVELKKILAGNFPDHQVHHIIDLGVSDCIGFPSGCKSEDFAEVYKRTAGKGYEMMEATLLSALFKTADEVNQLHKRLKMSKAEYTAMLFIVKHRSIYRRGDRKHYQDLIVDDSDKKSTHAKCIQLAAYMDDSSVYHSLRDWTIPRMPFSAKVFVEAGVPKGKDMTGAVNLIKQHWKDSDFRADDGELQRYATKLISDGIVKTKS